MFEYNSKSYELKMNLERMQMVEATIRSGSLMSEFINNSGYFSIATIVAVFKFCLHEVGSNVYVPQAQGVEIAQAVLNEKGYGPVALMIQEAMKNDLPFLFQAN